MCPLVYVHLAHHYSSPLEHRTKIFNAKPPPYSQIFPHRQKLKMSDSNTLRLPLPPPEYSTADNPLKNLSAIQSRVDSLSRILSNSVNTNTPLPKTDSDNITAELISAVHHIIINGAALIASSSSSNGPGSITISDGDEDIQIIELDVEDITSDNSHTCKICGKGFKRDANLRMHMRAHGDQFKTLESLSNPKNIKYSHNQGRKTRFSCPYIGCNRNKNHENFRSLKSAICVKNHFKRFHCPKMFSCNRCNKKSFSVLSDLKSHMKNCVENLKKWEYCSCGLRFGSRDELFGHLSMCEGHMPQNSNFDSGFFDEFGLIKDENQEMSLWSSIEDITHLL
ncbi:unnamed protein product [Amaranthus hypochondriacus]